jgi:hypothetical protein
MNRSQVSNGIVFQARNGMVQTILYKRKNLSSPEPLGLVLPFKMGQEMEWYQPLNLPKSFCLDFQWFFIQMSGFQMSTAK